MLRLIIMIFVAATALTIGGTFRASSHQYPKLRVLLFPGQHRAQKPSPARFLGAAFAAAIARLFQLLFPTSVSGEGPRS